MQKTGLMKKLLFLFFFAGVLFTSCQDNVLPKPKAFLALNYPEAAYSQIHLSCPYTFKKNEIAKIEPSRDRVPCWINLKYPLLDGSIFLTYQQVHGNLDSLLTDAQKLPLEHTIKADFIQGDVYTNKAHNVYGMFYTIGGNAASQAEFYVTDSVKHFMTGSLYFNHKPNFDSIYPAAQYIKRDMKHLMESLRWKE